MRNIKFKIIFVLFLLSLGACNSTSDLSNNEDTSEIENEALIIATIYVDINPSLYFDVNQFKKVAAATPINSEAKSMETNDYVGMDIDDAIEEHILRVSEAGFIDTYDLENDYVLLTTILADENDPLNDDLFERIQTKIENSEVLKTVNVIEMIVDQETQDKASAQEMSAGLYALNVELYQNEYKDYISTHELFKDQARAEDLIKKKNLIISDISIEHMRINIQNVLDQLKLKNIEINDYASRLKNCSLEDCLALQKELILNYGKSAQEISENVESVLMDTVVDYASVTITKEQGSAPLIHVRVSANEALSVYVLVEADNVYANNSYTATQVVSGISPAANQAGYTVIHAVYQNNGTDQTYTINMADYVSDGGQPDGPTDGPPEGEGGFPVALVVLKDAVGNTSEIIAK